MENRPLPKKVEQDKTPVINKFFSAAIKMEASDLHLKGDCLPRFRVKGSLRQAAGEPLDNKEVEEMVLEILSDEQRKFFAEHGALDFAYDMGGTDRFRTNIYRQRGKVSLAGRRVSSIIPKFETLNLPPQVERIADNHQGLILVTGVTGSGKSTTIASMLNYINRNRACHIITIEDPIEFVYEDAKALVSQREIGVDVPSFDEALRSLMREDPDVVLIGEMRDYTTLVSGIKAAETGHLVFGTLHSTDAYQTVTRILDITPQIERHMIRQALVGNMRAVVSQMLLPSIKEGVSRVPVVEIMITNPAVRKLVAEEREVELPTVIRSSYSEGMVDFTESLRQLIEREFIEVRTAFNYAPRPEELKMALKGIRSSSAGITG